MQSVRRCATLLGRGWAGTRRSKTRIDLLALAPDTVPRRPLIVNVANCLESFDDGLVIDNGHGDC
jgi:hypothetical protein